MSPARRTSTSGPTSRTRRAIPSTSADGTRCPTRTASRRPCREPVCGGVGVHDRQVAGVGRVVTLRGPGLAGLHFLAGPGPPRPAAIQHSHVRVPVVGEQPPGPGRRPPAPVVVDHHGPVAPHTGSLHRRREAVRVGQRVPSALVDGIARRVREVGPEVDVRRAGDVPREVLLVPVRAPELVANVQHRHVAQDARKLLG